MKLYDSLTDWYSLLTPVEDYVEEASAYRAVLRDALGPGRHRLLELGAGAGHNAHHFADDFDLVLSDLSPRMLDLARETCPGAELVAGDMRALRLGRRFDAVFLHDAVCYMRTEDDLRAAFETARVHLREGGVFVVAPDHVAETFEPGTDTGGADADGRSLRYLEWTWLRDGARDGYVVDFTLVTRVGDAMPEVHHDRHEEGLFARATWEALLAAAGFDVTRVGWRHSEVDRELELFVGRAR